MKKIIAFFTLLSVLLLGGCKQKDLIDIYVFSQRFSRYSDNFAVDTGNLTASEEEGELAFPLIFDDKFLLTVRTNDETALMTSFSAVYMFKNGRKLSDGDFLLFTEIVESAVKAFTKQEKTDEILEQIPLRNKSDALKNNRTSFTIGFYDYSFICDEVGIYFYASTERR